MVAKSPDHSLAVYPRAEFEEEIARRVASTPRNDPAARADLRVFAAGADEQHPDAQGRITLSADHRRYASLTKECVVIGAVDYLEIWDAAAWQNYQTMTTEQRSVLRDAANGNATAATRSATPTGLAREAAQPLPRMMMPTTAPLGRWNDRSLISSTPL